MKNFGTIKLFTVVGLATLTTLSLSSTKTLAQTSQYGCFQVINAEALNIRRFSYSRSRVLGVAVKGQKLAKWKRFCAVRGFWCPVETKNGVRGFADKKFLKRVSC